MDDDLNTADALAAIFDIVYAANTSIQADSAKELVLDALSAITELGDVLGLFQQKETAAASEEIEALIAERNAARAEKNWARADEIRDRLKEMNVELKDTPNGVQWTIRK